MSGLVATASSAFISSAGRENEAENHAKFNVNKFGFVIKMVKPCARALIKKFYLVHELLLSAIALLGSLFHT